MRRLALLALILAPSIPRPTGACSQQDPYGATHELDAAFASDAVPPSAVTVTTSVYRPSGGSGGCDAVDCDPGRPFVRLDLQATDDRATTDRIGYQLAIVRGDAPAGMTLPVGAVLTNGGEVLLHFNEGAADFAVDVEVRAVDLNGNLGPASITVISNKE